MNSNESIVVIPARLESKRLPGKILADIEGKTMIQRVIESCLDAKLPQRVVLCTDNQKIADEVKRLNIEIFFTKQDCDSGSERISSVLHKIIPKNNLSNILIINVQGDQPFLDSNILDLMCNEFHKKNPKPDVLTPIYKLSPNKIHDPNVVKTLVGHDKKALYFSRSALPYVRGVDKEEWYKYYPYWGHVGIYGYRGDVLAKWSKLKNSKLSEMESLEQLKLIESGYKIGTFEVQGESLSVDTYEHLREARLIAKKKK